MVVFFGVLQLPEGFGRNMGTPAAELQDRSDVRLEGIPYHHQLCHVDTQFLSQDNVLPLRFVGHYLYVAEVFPEPGALYLVLLVQELALRKHD